MKDTIQSIKVHIWRKQITVFRLMATVTLKRMVLPGGVAHYNWFYKYLGLAALSWFGYFTLLVCREHLSLNLLNVGAVPLRASFALPWDIIINAWSCCYITMHFFIYYTRFADATRLAEDVWRVFLEAPRAQRRLPSSAGKVWVDMW